MGVFDFLKGGAKKAETAARSTAAAGTAAAGTAAAGTAAAGAAAVGATALGAAAEEKSMISSLFGEGGAQLTGVLDKLKLGGLDDTVMSWIGRGENKAVSAEQIKTALGSEQVAGVAAKLGVSPDDAAGKIAKLLPGIIDKLTPDGVVPNPDAIAGKLTGLFNR